jgi:hypothetical protein
MRGDERIQIDLQGERDPFMLPVPQVLASGLPKGAAMYIKGHTSLPAHDAVRIAVAAALVESSGSEAPVKSWARELSKGKLHAFASQPAAEHLLIDRLSTAFRAKHDAFEMDTAGGQPCDSEAEKVTKMQSSVMCKIGGPASPFERTRQQVMEVVGLEVTTAIEREEAEEQVVQTAKQAKCIAGTAIALCKEALFRDVVVPLRTMHKKGIRLDGSQPSTPRSGGDGVDRVNAILCFRPFRRYQMGTGILCQSGEALGNTFRGHEDFQMTDNIIAKTHIGHYTMWHKAVVVDDRRLYLAEDMFCSGYVAGENNKSKPFPEYPHEQLKFVEDPIAWMDGASILTLEVSLESRHANLPRSFDLCNLKKELDVHKIEGTDVTRDVISWIEEAFQGLNSAYDVAAAEDYLTAGGTVNAKCFRTMEVDVTPAGHRSIRTLNQGHFGVNGCYEGARRPRSGFIETFKDCKYEQTYLTRR